MAGEPLGKSAKYGRAIFHNNSDKDCRVWIRPKGTPLPKTVKELDRMMISVSAHRQNRRTGRLRYGNYTCTTFYASDIQHVIDKRLNQRLFYRAAQYQKNVKVSEPQPEPEIVIPETVIPETVIPETVSFPF